MSNVFIVAEIGQAHEGSLGIAHSYIDALADTGVDAIKFQTHIAEAESSIHEPFRIKFSYEDATRMDYWRRMEFTTEQWIDLKKHCKNKKVEFISSPFSNAAVEVLEQLGVAKYKIGSGEMNNLLLLQRVASTGKEIILSSGMSSLNELDATINFLKGFGNKLSILQCTTSYPTTPDQWGLNVLPVLRERYGLPVGFSDHSGDIFACLAATALGAQIIEFHAVFDKRMFGPDTSSSLTIDDIKRLVTGIRQIEKSRTNEVDKDNAEMYSGLKSIFEKSLAVNKDLKQGHILSLNDLEAKKPKGFGIDARLFNKVVGKQINRSMQKWEFLTEKEIDEV